MIPTMGSLTKLAIIKIILKSPRDKRIKSTNFIHSVPLLTKYPIPNIIARENRAIHIFHSTIQCFIFPN